MTTARSILLIMAAAIVCPAQSRAAQQAKASLGSSDFASTPEHPFGWRGDGTGRFPDATPPVRWGRMAKSVKSMRLQVNKPNAGDAGTPAPDGSIRQWPVLGPLNADEELELLRSDADGKLSCSPSENEKLGQIVWKKAETDVTVDLSSLLGPGKVKDFGYAHTYVFSEAKARFRLGNQGLDKVYVNGTLLKSNDFDLEEGWNRVLVRSACGRGTSGGQGTRPSTWYFRMAIFRSRRGHQGLDRRHGRSALMEGSGAGAALFLEPRASADDVLLRAVHRSAECHECRGTKL